MNIYIFILLYTKDLCNLLYISYISIKIKYEYIIYKLDAKNSRGGVIQDI